MTALGNTHGQESNTRRFNFQYYHFLVIESGNSVKSSLCAFESVNLEKLDGAVYMGDCLKLGLLEAYIGRVYRLSQSIGSCVRFNWLHLTGESRQFIHTVTAEALKLPINQ